MTITWGAVQFSEPKSFALWDPPFRAALYAIMRQADPVNNPTSFRILYFGESGNLSERGFESHHKLDCWKYQVDSVDDLYVGVYLMAGSTVEQRRELESVLVEKYNPICND